MFSEGFVLFALNENSGGLLVCENSGCVLFRQGVVFGFIPIQHIHYPVRPTRRVFRVFLFYGSIALRVGCAIMMISGFVFLRV